MRNVPEMLFSICWFVGLRSFGFNLESNMYNENRIYPWIGVLRVKSGTTQPDGMTGLIMIQKNLAMGIANEVAIVGRKRLRNFSNAMFFTNNKWRDCRISNYTLHPEYFEGLSNTLALLFLSCDSEITYWHPITWPTNYTAYDNVYSIQLTDRLSRLQQVTERMEAVKERECDEIYRKEELDYKSLQPSHRVCYKVLNSVRNCVIDAGMALVVRSRNNWILIGISILGPSCALPARFIQFYPYTSWIKSHLRPVKIGKSMRRLMYDKQGMEEPYEDQDTLFLSKINDSTVVMRPSLANVVDEVYGDCDKIDGVLMYREFGTIRTPSYTAAGIHSISLYDLFFPKITCVRVTVVCNQRSPIMYWIDSGFHQEDIEDYVKTIYIPKRNSTKPPKLVYLKDVYKKYRPIGIGNLEFKFEFTNEAKIDIQIYGRNISWPMEAPMVPQNKETAGKVRAGGAEFKAREDEPDDNLDVTNDSFYHS